MITCFKKALAPLSLVILAIMALGCGGSMPLTNMTARELFDAGKEKYDNGKYYKATEYFQSIVYNYPAESIIDTAQYYLGLAYYGDEDYELAQTEFNRLVLNYPSSVYFESAMLLRAVCAYESAPDHYGLDQSELEQAIKLLDDFIIDFPESEYVADARKYLLEARTRMARKYYSSAVVYTRMRAHAAALVYYQIVIDDYTDTEFGPGAVYGYAETEFHMGEYDEARTRFETFRTIYPEHELSERAFKMAEVSAFKSGEKAFRQNDYQTAKERLQDFIEKYRGNDKQRLKKAYEYLETIDKTTAKESQVENASSREWRGVGDTGRNL